MQVQSHGMSNQIQYPNQTEHRQTEAWHDDAGKILKLYRIDFSTRQADNQENDRIQQNTDFRNIQRTVEYRDNHKNRRNHQ